METPMGLEMEEDMMVYQKEKELREVVTARIRTLSLGLYERDEEISVLRMKLTMLDKDFRCNVQQLREKEEEMEELELELEDLQRRLSDKDEELGGLVKRINDMDEKVTGQAHEMEENESHFRNKITEMNEKMEELRRQTEWKLQQCEQEKEEDRKRYEQQTLELERELNLQRSKLEEEHRAAISRLEMEHTKAATEFTEAIQKGDFRIKKLEQEIKILQTLSKTLNKDQEKTENKLKEVSSLYKNELERLNNLYQAQKSDYETKLQEINQQFEKERNVFKEFAQFTQEKFKENNIKVTNNTDKFDDGEGIILYLREMFTDLLNDVNKHAQENQMLNQKLSQQSQNGTEDVKSQHDLKSIKHQNTILKEIIKNMRQKINHINVGNENQNEITKPDITFDGNNACEASVSDSFVQMPISTQTHEVPISEDCDALPVEWCPENSLQCRTCEGLKQDLVKQRQESYQQLQILKNKIEKLTDISGGETCEDTDRLQKLEETITFLKNRMLNDLKGKLQKEKEDLGTDKMTITDVRMMLLEQKLERITSNIGEAMTSEKEALLKAVYLVKDELKMLFQEAKKNEKLVKKSDPPKKKSDEMISKILSEISELKEKLKKSYGDELTTGNASKGPKERVKIIKHMQCNIPNHERRPITSQKMTEDVVPECSSHMNFIQHHNTEQSTRYTVHGRKTDELKPFTARQVTQSSSHLGIDEVWALLDEPTTQDILIKGPTDNKVVLQNRAKKLYTSKNHQ